MHSTRSIRPAAARVSPGLLGHVPQLDALRAFAVAGVLVRHYVPCEPLAVLGTAGVKLFFVLSGFLITRILLAARRDVQDGRQGHMGAVGRF